MSRLPTLTTPGRSSIPSPQGSGIPTPASRRPRASIGPSPAPSLNKHDPEMGQALKDVLSSSRRRPPSSLGMTPVDRPESPPTLNLPGGGGGGGGERDHHRPLQTPRTPSYRPRTPSSMQTPGSSRPSSRPSLVAPRQSLAGPSNTPSRRASMASSTSTPYRRPDSRAGALSESISGKPWKPEVGDRVRLPSHGYEGTLRYLGETHIRDGIWAGVELQGGFQGKGRNDGSVDGVRYFECAPNCGIFALADKLAPPTAETVRPSRPPSVSSQRSLVSSYSASGRMTPSGTRRGATTPSFGTRSVNRKPDDDASSVADSASRRTLNGTTSTAARAAEAKITAGSRASRYLGMTAKQLDARAAATSTGIKSSLSSSTTTTPKQSRIGLSGTTPNRGVGGITTPKARTARLNMSVAGVSASEMMPPPPSPQAAKTATANASANANTNVNANAAQTAVLEEELQQLRSRNLELEEEVTQSSAASIAAAEDHQLELEELRLSVEQAKLEADELRHQLAASTGQATEDRQRSEELTASGDKLKEDLETKERELAEVRKEAQVAAERATGELEAGMEAKREEVQRTLERAESAEMEASDLKRLVDELTSAGNQLIELNESKQLSFEMQIRELEEQMAQKEDEIRQHKVRAAAADLSPHGSPSKRAAVTAAEIDNETLTDQVKHLQSRISNLEEQLDEARAQAEKDSDAWQAKYSKSKADEQLIRDDLDKTKGEVQVKADELAGANARIADLNEALKDNKAALEAARADIETLRAESAEAESALRSSEASESQAKISELEGQLQKLSGAEQRSAELETKIQSLEAEVVSLKSSRSRALSASPVEAEGDENALQRSTSASQGRSSLGSMEDAEKSIRGYQHIVSEMSAENASLKSRHVHLQDEIGMLKEEIKLLQDINETDPGVSGGKELAELKARVTQQAQTIKELEREVSELESLIESKIYREDELETRLAELERDAGRWRSKANKLAAAAVVGAGAPPPTPGAPAPRPPSAGMSASDAASLSSRSRPVSGTSTGTAPRSRPVSGSSVASHTSATSAADSSVTRCELCEGPHDLDACPIFSGSTLDGAGAPAGAPAGANGRPNGTKGQRCADCESTAHATAQCPLADDMF